MNDLDRKKYLIEPKIEILRLSIKMNLKSYEKNPENTNLKKQIEKDKIELEKYKKKYPELFV
jgi:hypothetical protein